MRDGSSRISPVYDLETAAKSYRCWRVLRRHDGAMAMVLCPRGERAGGLPAGRSRLFAAPVRVQQHVAQPQAWGRVPVEHRIGPWFKDKTPRISYFSHLYLILISYLSHLYLISLSDCPKAIFVVIPRDV